MVEITTEIVGMLDTNCYLVPTMKRLYVIDPGAEADSIFTSAKKYGSLEPIILLTHAHVDHIGGIGELAMNLGVTQVYLHRADLRLYNSPDNHLQPFVPLAKDLLVPAHTIVQDDFVVIETPGHTPGGVCFLFHHLPALFTGDTLFAGSIGRTDLPGGDYDMLMASITEKILSLPDELRVYPGHGNATSIAKERHNNPYLQ
jgi:glyoxylase-like metal-dependent hydrolase (beta-lactamase superfamily II)